MDTKQPKYKRILLKLSGEALAEGGDGILNFDFVAKVGEVLKRCLDLGVEIGVIVGAGNIWRGRQGGKMNRVRADQMGMLATTINSLALQDTFIGMGIPTRVMTAFELNTVADPFSARHAIEHLQNGEIVIFGGGTGSPYFSTDTAAALRAAEIHADAMLMAKNIDYLYDADPKKNPDAKPIYDITYNEIIEKNLRAFDMSAVIFCQDTDIEAYGFGLADPENIYRAVMGEPVGTRMHN